MVIYMDDCALVSASDMSKYGASWADAYLLPGNRYMAKAAGKCDCVCLLFILFVQQTFVCMGCQLFI
jgi:hypothetical protein